LTAIRETMAIEEVAALVCTTLDQHGIRVVLSGGAVVSIYSHNEYQSKDLDFIAEGISKQVAPAMQELGFTKETGRHWTHPRTEYWVEFPPGPVQVGDTIVTEHAEITTSVGVLRLLAPTECVMDRLAAYYHWNDPQGLEQAIRVALKCDINLDRIEAWSKRERATVKFKNFAEELKSRGSPP
jgi:hypothetical protein